MAAIETSAQIVVGDYLTTQEEAAESDRTMLEDLGFEIEECAL